jgi:small conductance mechanosensitive channel
MDASLSSFLQSFVSISLIIFLIIITVSTLGVDTSSFVALLAGSGLAVGMALSGTLQNFAGGIMILLFRPFKVGDFIDAGGNAGTVKSIKITATELITPDRKVIIVPNGQLSSGTINNYSSSDKRRCEWNIGISYGDNYDNAEKVIKEMLGKNPMVLNDPEPPFVGLSQLGDSAVVLVVRAWVESGNYWALFFEMNARFYKELPGHGINFPFPQMDVHLDGKKENGN